MTTFPGLPAAPPAGQQRRAAGVANAPPRMPWPVPLRDTPPGPPHGN